MGEAKRRGSYEQRRAEGLEKTKKQRELRAQRELQTKRNIETRRRLRRSGYKTLFHYIDPSRAELVKEIAGSFSAPWRYEQKAIDPVEAEALYGPSRQGSRARGLSKATMLTLLASASSFI